MQVPSVSSWYSVSPEKKALKPRKIGPADVYNQDPKQEEDNMSVTRVQKGYIINVLPCEHESLIYNSKVRSGVVMVHDSCRSRTLRTWTGSMRRWQEVRR